jgi:hypothetical protein
MCMNFFQQSLLSGHSVFMCGKLFPTMKNQSDKYNPDGKEGTHSSSNLWNKTGTCERKL